MCTFKFQCLFLFVFFSVTVWRCHSTFNLNEQYSVKARYLKQNILNVVVLKFPGL